MELHKEVLADMIPPKKYLLRHQPVKAQIGLMDGNTLILQTYYVNAGTIDQSFFNQTNSTARSKGRGALPGSTHTMGVTEQSSLQG